LWLLGRFYEFYPFYGRTWDQEAIDIFQGDLPPILQDPRWLLNVKMALIMLTGPFTRPSIKTPAILEMEDNIRNLS
jgi:hypothetical protein